MAQQYVMADGIKYRIRGPYTAEDLKRIYASYLDEAYANANNKYQTKMTFREWLVERGKVHNRVQR